MMRDVRLPGSSELRTVVCAGGRISDISTVAPAVDGMQVIEGAGDLLLPAFIDVHSHADGRAWTPDISLPKAQQGVSYEIVGNCGLGPSPNSNDPGWRTLISGVLGGVPLTGELGSFPNFLERLRDANAGRWPHVGALLPYGAVRASIAGLDVSIDSQGRDHMRASVDEALAAGATGVSLGLVYPPNDASTFSELAEVLTPLRKHGAVLTTHIRSQANRWIQAIDEVLRLARKLDCRLVISHLCVGGARNQWQLDWVLPKLQQERNDGLDVWFDHHPYRAGSTSLTQLLPSGVLRTVGDGIAVTAGRDEVSALLSRPSVIEGWENYVELIGPSKILVAGANVPGVAGCTLAEIQSEWGLDISGTLLRLLTETRGGAAIVLQELYRQEAIERISELDFGVISTDGIHGGDIPHPRLYGTYPYAFSTLVSGGVMSETEFVDRTSVRPAEIFDIGRNPGLVPGADSDLVLVNPATFGHETNYLQPAQPVTGLRALVYGGTLWRG
jgi:N-acyl-D-aspartate/D-glutamate deacylase